MSVSGPCLIRSRGASGEPVVRLGMPLVDDYLEFLDGRCRPNTVLAAAYDLRVFFGVVGKPADEIRSADVLGFITSQRTGRSGAQVVQPLDPGDEPGGVSTRRERSRPGQGMRLTRRRRTLPRILTPAEVDALTVALRTSRPRDGRRDGARRFAPM